MVRAPTESPEEGAPQAPAQAHGSPPRSPAASWPHPPAYPNQPDSPHLDASLDRHPQHMTASSGGTLGDGFGKGHPDKFRDAEADEDDLPDPTARKVKRIIIGVLVLLGVVLAVLGVILGVYISRQKASSAGADSAVALDNTTSPNGTASPGGNPLGNYNYSGWTGGCQGCGQYGSYNGGGVLQSGRGNSFGVSTNLSDPVECNAWSIFANISYSVDVTNATALNLGVRAQFLRTIFHDSCTFSKAAYDAYIANPTPENFALVGGMDGSLYLEMDRGDNVGLEKVAKWVNELYTRQSPDCPIISRADIYAMGATLSASTPMYGSPAYNNPNASIQIAVPILLGRKDSDIENPKDRLPTFLSTSAEIFALFNGNLGLTGPEIAAIIGGSHSLGGVNMVAKDLPPPIGPQYPTFFVGPINGPRSNLSNANLVQMLNQKALLPTDNGLATFTETAQAIKTFASNQTAFYETYFSTFTKLSLFSQDRTQLRVWTPPGFSAR